MTAPEKANQQRPETNSVPQIAHNDHCWSYGSKHYECAIRHVANQHERIHVLEEAARAALISIKGSRSQDHLEAVIAPILADALKRP